MHSLTPWLSFPVVGVTKGRVRLEGSRHGHFAAPRVDQVSQAW